MLNAFGSHLRTNLIGYLALMVALGGTSYAAVNLPAKSVGPKQLKASAVTTPKLKGNSVTTAKLKGGAVTGAKLAPGSVGAGHVQPGLLSPAVDVIDEAQVGAVNPLPAPYTTILEAPALEPGAYLILGKSVAVNWGTGDFVRCRIRADGASLDQTNTHVGGSGAAATTTVAELTTMATFTSDEPFGVDLACGHDSGATNPYIEASRLQVIRVNSAE